MSGNVFESVPAANRVTRKGDCNVKYNSEGRRTDTQPALAVLCVALPLERAANFICHYLVWLTSVWYL